MRSPTPTPPSPLASRILASPSISSKKMIAGLDARALQHVGWINMAGCKVKQGKHAQHACRTCLQSASVVLCMLRNCANPNPTLTRNRAKPN